MTLAEAQADMRDAYYGGVPGVIASAAAWLGAGVVAATRSPASAVWALFFGGMLIHPAAVLLAKALGRRGGHAPGNPLAALALEGTVFFLLGVAVALAVSLDRVEWFFPAMLLLIGGRYLTFATLYGTRVFWGGGAALAAAGFLVFALRAPAWAGAFAGAAAEFALAGVLLAAARRGSPAPSPHAA
jgi:hypothetical protein